MSLSSTNSFENSPVEKPTEGTPDHSECLKVLNLVLDQEATDEEQAYFKQHIENCMPYYEIYNVDKAIKSMIKDKCLNQKTPSDLVESIKSKIYQQAD
ncbi:anti-sigma factor [Fulvivirga maritima]|uniref:anti-sigma factor n=1 Tax=Fulvivirga maritima TaxID=2904247 RepID=UPI001F1F2343|nr:anti-sigma factor [Fulvivirga maritima]UII28820.1 anti-sigma factor [Fulvivirga maritima]